jgi:hypothetical protein
VQNVQARFKKGRLNPRDSKKYFPHALDYALKNNVLEVRVNQCRFIFDFDDMTVKIASSFDNYNYSRYKLIKK